MIPSVLLPSSVLTLGVTLSPLLFQQDTCDCAPIRMGLEKGGERGEDQICLRPQTISKADPAAYRRNHSPNCRSIALPHLLGLLSHSSAVTPEFNARPKDVGREECVQEHRPSGTQIPLLTTVPQTEPRVAAPEDQMAPRSPAPPCLWHTLSPGPYTPMLLPHWSHSWAA